VNLAHGRRLCIEVVVWRRGAARRFSVLLRGSGGCRVVSAPGAGRQGEGASDDERASHRVQTFALVDTLRKTASRPALAAALRRRTITPVSANHS
jgi:hypothetical protein